MATDADADVIRAIAVLALAPDPVISPDRAMGIFTRARTEQRSPGELLLELVGEPELLAAIARELDLPYIDFYARDNEWIADPQLLADLNVSLLTTANALPLRNADGEVAVAMTNPFAHGDIVSYLERKLGPVRRGIALRSHIEAKLVQLASTDLSGLDMIEVPETAPVAAAPTTASSNPVVEWVDKLFARASAEGASDVHFMFNLDGTLLVRFRLDGVLRHQPVPPQLRHRELEIVGTLLSKCPTIDPSDKTRPQDGTFSFTGTAGKRIDTRLAMLPQAHGPTVVVRLLDPANVRRRLEDMGFAPQTLVAMRHAVSRPQGMVLMVGPTGSGKTTSLYGLLNELDATSLNILTAEDPIEYRMANIGQTQIRGDLGDKSLTFAKTLRAFLRLDPDVLLVGEIRDSETATVAMHASLTGHLVLSTLHTNSALGVITRLAELGVEPFAIAEALSLSASQRLVRRLHTCKSVAAPTDPERRFLERQGLPVPDLVATPAPGGCSGCAGTGYRGRIPVVEALTPDETVKTLIATEAPADQIREAAVAAGYVSMVGDAHRHVEKLETSVAELLRCLDLGGL